MTKELWLILLCTAGICAGLAAVERRSFSSKEIALIAVLAALAALGRVPFAVIPNAQPTTFIVITSGAVFGSAVGFTVGAAAALVSNIFLGHGPWTFFQMLAWGLCGLSAGLLLRAFPKIGAAQLAVFGFVWGYLFGWIMNFWHWYAFVYPLTFTTWLATCTASAWFDTVHALTNAMFFLLFGGELVKILRRFQKKLAFTYTPLQKEEESMIRAVTVFQRSAAALLFVLIFAIDAQAIDVETPDGFAGGVRAENVAGGFDYLPDGDVLAFNFDFINGPSLRLFDANGDGSPAAAVTIVSYDPFTFGTFVRVSPDGSFALFGTSGTVDKVQRVSLDTFAVSNVADISGSFEAVFIDDSSLYLSANPGGFDPNVPNSIFRIDLDNPNNPQTIAEIPNTPSGALAINSSGDLYYIKGTFAFPAPPATFRLLRFSKASLEQAEANGTILSESDSAISVPLDGGFSMEINRFTAFPNEVYLSTTGNTILKISEDTLTPEVFAAFTDPLNAALPSATILRFTRPRGRFEANGPVGSVLGTALAANFFSEFLLSEIAPVPLDSDNDGVLDIDEEKDGTDRFDRGSVTDQLRSPVYALWNGFLDMTNILELINSGRSPLSVDISLFTIDGTLGSTRTVQLEPGRQFDVILNDFPGFSKHSFGLVKIEFFGFLDGRLSFYRATEKADRFDFVFGLPLTNPLRGKTAAAFNTFQPSLDAAEANNAVEAWLSIVNLATTEKRFVVRKFNQQGLLLSTDAVNVAPRSRVDLEAGHVNPGPGQVGTTVIDPDDDSAEYFAQLIRYGKSNDGGYNFAFALAARAASGRPMTVPITSELGASNWLELSNCLDDEAPVNVLCFDAEGSERLNQRLVLESMTQLHLEASSLLNTDENGLCVIVPHIRESIIAQSMRYYRSAAGSIRALGGSPSRETLNTSLFGTYNLFLGMENALRLLNPTGAPATVQVTIDAQGVPVVREVELPPFGSAELLLHDTAEFGIAANTYGAVHILNQQPGQVYAETVRTRLEPGTADVDYSVSTVAR